MDRYEKTELQILVCGPNIGQSKLAIRYPGVTLKELAKPQNPNYVFVYITIAKGTKPGTVPMRFTNGRETWTYNYPLKDRGDKSGTLGFNASDVLYLITPDRFANGQPDNDNLEDVAVNRENPNSRHGGDLAGLAQHLDYLKDLGITTVWLNPVQENKMRGGSYHGYAITDFYKIDPRFGSNEEFRALTKATHEKGMKMVMDRVLNHCGSSHWWMNDLPSKDWINNGGVFFANESCHRFGYGRTRFANGKKYVSPWMVHPGHARFESNQPSPGYLSYPEQHLVD